MGKSSKSKGITGGPLSRFQTPSFQTPKNTLGKICAYCDLPAVEVWECKECQRANFVCENAEMHADQGCSHKIQEEDGSEGEVRRCPGVADSIYT